MKCVIYDYETLGKDVRTLPILSLAIFSFDTNVNYAYQEIVNATGYYKFSVEDQVKNYGRKIEKETLDWWSQQDKSVFESQVKPSKNDLPLAALYDIMKKHVGEKDIVFTRGNTFDPMVTQFIMESIGKVDPVPFWNVRDTRSFIEGLSYGSGLKNNFTPPELEGQQLALHDPRTDIALDVLRIQSLIRAIS